MMSARGEIVRSGYLIKSPPDAQKIAQWKKRWFVLADSRLVYPLADRYVRLEYYASEMEAKRLADPKGVIDLIGCTRVITREPIKGHRSVFDVCTADRVYHLAAESAAEKAEWIYILNDLLFTHKNAQQAAQPQARRSGQEMFRSGHRLSEPDITEQTRQQSRPRSLTNESRAPPSSRPLPPVPSEDSRSRPLPPPPSEPSHQQPSTPVARVYKPRNRLPSPLATNAHPVVKAQHSVPQSAPVCEHYEVGPGQKPIVGSAPRVSQPAPVPAPRPKPRPKPKGALLSSSPSAKTTDRDENYSYIDDADLAEDQEYSYLGQSTVPGYDPSNDEYSHLEDVNSRERHTAPALNQRGRRKAYENVPHVAQDDDDYSHLKH